MGPKITSMQKQGLLSDRIPYKLSFIGVHCNDAWNNNNVRGMVCPLLYFVAVECKMRP
jgi:hypothetical protein